MKYNTKKIILSLILFILGAGIYGGIISFACQYMQKNDFAPLSKPILLGLLVFGLYHLQRWLYRRI